MFVSRILVIYDTFALFYSYLYNIKCIFTRNLLSGAGKLTTQIHAVISVKVNNSCVFWSRYNDAHLPRFPL